MRLLDQRCCGGRGTPGQLSKYFRGPSIRVLAVGVFIAALCAFWFPGVASANYYAFAQLSSTGNFKGTQLSLKSAILTVPNLSTDFADNDSWVDKDGSVNYWIEAGLIKGTFCCTHEATETSFFWADSRTNGGGFNSHLGPHTTLNTYFNDQILYQGSGNWSVNVGGYTGTSTNTFTNSSYIQTGTEVTTTQAEACANQTNLGWWDSSLTFHSGWSDTSSGQATLYQDSPPNASWIDRPNHLDDWINYSC